ncbi:KPN_02809 family neutral zinc metallopeptidase [Pedobacter sp. CFBP9032]|uniref:KPN_02809 family neutral zinc metallopeptidase n=1 Tax=Pedobacter sp. CFBP9032 TaxID=3096539 RepID=UPI002A6B52CF|nr:neutral zinc metallopeptidase [Pedobacter sp. CFBP9032]MDY0905309.1 neutral zinc metallopeptidase [Pedobacter sp. CFBP9032]
MQWFGKGSGDVEDRRSSGGGGRTILGGGVGIIVVVLGLIFGKDLTGLVGQTPGNTGGAQTEGKMGVPEDEQGRFVSNVLQSTYEVWEQEFQKMGETYENPKLVLFRDGVQTACGNASADVGPFYCPGDHKVYIDLSFYDDLKNRFGAAGDFAQAYVIAHEVGHHVQNVLGISEKLDQARGKVSEKEYNRLSVKLELQADFFAGLWAHHAQNLKDFKLEEGDIEEALTAANAIGDDKLQKQATGDVQPDSFTHGTSQQRMFWFKKGFDTGDFKQGDTFTSGDL